MDSPRPYGDYLLLERLGVGGMSEVDLARKRGSNGQLVVIKRIKAGKTDDDSFLRMFKDEARITSELHHPNIARFVDFGRVDDEYYLALEYIPGVDLGQLLRALRERGERIPLRIALRVLCDALHGLDHAHHARDRFGQPMRVVHRDVSPRNVMISVAGQVKLIDFGVARATNRLEHTTANLVKGKFNYMAPEQIAGEAVDHRADVFAAGLLLHELLTGAPPFHGLTRSSIAHHLLTGNLPDRPTHPEFTANPALVAAYDRALAAERDDRYPTAEAFRADLMRVAGALGGLPDDRALAAFVALLQPDASRAAIGRTRQKPTATPVPARTRTNPLLRPPQARTLAWGVLAASALTGALLSTAAVAVLVWVLAPTPPTRVADLAPADAEPATAVAVSGSEPAPEPEPKPVQLAVAERAAPAPRVAPKVAPAAAPSAASGTAAPEPRKIVVITPSPTVAPEPAVVRISPASAPEPAPVARPAPAPAPEPGISDVVEPVVLPVITAVVEPVAAPPAPTGVGTGFLRVASTPPGSLIRVDGKDTGLTTPAEFPWATGTVEVEVVGVGKRVVAVARDQLSVVTVR